MYHLLLALAFQMDPAVQAQREMLLQLQLRRMQDHPHYAQIKKHREEVREAAIREYFFAQKFNKLINKLKKFTTDYNAGKVDARTVSELKKAWRNLEKDDGWFREADPPAESDGRGEKPPEASKVDACGTS
jgi:hypothetical protein